MEIRKSMKRKIGYTKGLIDGVISMEIRKSMKRKIGYTKGLIEKYAIWVYSIVTLIIVFSAFLFCFKFSYDPGGRDYLLSAVSQVLGATFALVFTITLLIAEISAKYSSRMVERFFTKWMVAYMFLFIVSILFSLVALMHIGDLAVKASLILCTTCLLLLIPYLMSFKDKLSPKKFLEDLWIQAVKNSDKNDELPEEAKIINNVVMSSYSSKDYDTFEIGVEKLVQLGIVMDTKRNIEIAFEIFERIRDIGLATIEDPRAPIIVIRTLRKGGIEAFDKKLQVSPIYILSGLDFIGTMATIKQMMIAPTDAADAIEHLGLRAASERSSSVIDAARGLKDIGTNAVTDRMVFLRERIAEKLWFLSASVAKNLPGDINSVTQEILKFEYSVGDFYVEEGLKNTKRRIETSHPDLKLYLEEIQKCYKQQKI